MKAVFSHLKTVWVVICSCKPTFQRFVSTVTAAESKVQNRHARRCESGGRGHIPHKAEHTIAHGLAGFLAAACEKPSVLADTGWVLSTGMLLLSRWSWEDVAVGTTKTKAAETAQTSPPARGGPRFSELQVWRSFSVSLTDWSVFVLEEELRFSWHEAKPETHPDGWSFYELYLKDWQLISVSI